MATGDWLTEGEVLAYLKVDPAGDNAPAVKAARSAAVRLVERRRKDLALDQLPAYDVAALAELDDIRLGAMMLAGRLYARRGTPEGIATFGELGASMILRRDPDVAQLLGLDNFGTPGLA